jgi:hypothetical protein
MHSNDRDDSFYREYIKKHTNKNRSKSNLKKLKPLQMNDIWEDPLHIKHRNRGMSGATG